jgi:hypothetical protein
VLLEHSELFVQTFAEKLLTYALGRSLEATDMPAVRKIKREAERENFRFGALIHGIVTSTPFTMRLAVEDAN